jgi:hypothetical protein
MYKHYTGITKRMLYVKIKTQHNATYYIYTEHMTDMGSYDV